MQGNSRPTQGLKMSRKIFMCCVALSLNLAFAAAVQRCLDSIEELRLPANVLLLLRWFANEVDFDRNRNAHLTFNPSTDHGSHRYYNANWLLPQGYHYYTVGNVNLASFPSYVLKPRTRNAWNTARIIFSVRQDYVQSQIIGRVYITQHFGRCEDQGTRYDPDSTYEITTNFLRQIRQLSIDEIYRHSADSPSRQSNTSHTLQGHYSASQSNYGPVRTTGQNDFVSNLCCCIGVFLLVIVIVFLVNLSSLQNIRKY